MSSSVDSGPLGVLVGLMEEPRDDAGAEPPHPRVADGVVAGEKAEEVALADTVATEHGDAFAEPQLEVERIGEPVELEPLDDHGPFSGAGAAEAYVEALWADCRRARVAFLELAKAALGSLQLRRERLGDLGPPAHLGHQVDEALTFTVVPACDRGRACRGGRDEPRRSRRSHRRASTLPRLPP